LKAAQQRSPAEKKPEARYLIFFFSRIDEVTTYRYWICLILMTNKKLIFYSIVDFALQAAENPGIINRIFGDLQEFNKLSKVFDYICSF
jgi:hypothetical protein